jgi:hypothetical protein
LPFRGLCGPSSEDIGMGNWNIQVNSKDYVDDSLSRIESGFLRPGGAWQESTVVRSGTGPGPGPSHLLDFGKL